MIPDDIVPIVVNLAEDHLLGRYQPRKSIRLLDQACAWCLVQQPPVAEVDELAVRSALEAETGQKLVDARSLTKDDLLETLRGLHRRTGRAPRAPWPKRWSRASDP